MCGRGGVAGGATPTSRQRCGATTGRQWQQRTGEWSTDSSTSSGEEDRESKSQEAEIKASGNSRMGKEPGEGKAFHFGEKVAWRKSEDEIEKLDEQRKKLQKDLRDVEKLSCVSKEVQDSLKKITCSRSCRRWRKGDMTSKELAKESTAAKQESAFVCCRTKLIRTEWQTRKWKQNFRDCKPENKEEEAMHRKRLIVAWR